jgi:ATP-dependent helicase/nuclease subunit A
MITPDQQQRQQAINPAHSVIVQAPAGSGKTELLTQRFLSLLTTVDHPESIYAITFTRKAAAQMRERIIEKLQLADGEQPTEPHQQQTWQLSRQVLARDKALNWQLLNNPNRLRVQTIDSLCAHLTRQLPITAQFGAGLQIADDTQTLYEKAAEKLLQTLDEKNTWQPALITLLRHLDNNLNTVKTLLANMLGKRDQWLTHILHAHRQTDIRSDLEKALQHINQEMLEHLQSAFSKQYTAPLQAFLAFARQHCERLDTLLALHEKNNNKKAFWLAASELLLTKQGTFRKTLTKTIGFPSQSAGKDKEEKKHFQSQKDDLLALIETLKTQPHLKKTLLSIRLAPDDRYAENQWHVLNALIILLRIACAQLRVVFGAHQQVDFIEIAQAALMALGDIDQPSDLALMLDYKIQHLLIDEFQDTSIPQLRLLEHLTAGWENDDGRTLFLVGDPMQSIYRFRNAEVGLFLHVRQHGLGALRLKALTLTSNFRSQEKLIDWINPTFLSIFPKENNESSSEIAYNPAVAMKAGAPNPVQCTLASTPDLEARLIAQTIQTLQEKNKTHSITILVQTRRQLTAILPALREKNIAYQGVDIDPLHQQAVINDLFSLTRALLHLGDRIAWLSCLRAPFCGLTLSALHTIANTTKDQTILQALSETQGLATDDQQRLTFFLTTLQYGLSLKCRMPLADWVNHVWQQLNGESCLQTDDEKNQAKTYFSLLAHLEQQGDVSIDVIEKKLKALFAENVAPQSVQIMTIHKSKGLEFDHVIIPGIERQNNRIDSPLLLWLERQAKQSIDLVLAPIKATGQNKDTIYQYIQHINRAKELQERRRLLYVAATRAKSQLHFTGCFQPQSDPPKPPENTFLSWLWPAVEHTISWETDNPTNNTADDKTQSPRLFSRLLSTAFITRRPQIKESTIDNTLSLEKPWESTPATIVGTLIHRALQQISLDNITDWTQQYQEEKKPYWQLLLAQAGLFDDAAARALTKIETAIKNTLNDERGRWILHPHTNAQSEFEITTRRDGKHQTLIIDRTFIDEENNAWVIDYKTTTRHQTSLTDFIEQEKIQHQEQLARYQQALSPLYQQPIRCALYFPLEPYWVEIDRPSLYLS